MAILRTGPRDPDAFPAMQLFLLGEYNDNYQLLQYHVLTLYKPLSD